MTVSFLEKICENDKYEIFTHDSPDGDTQIWGNLKRIEMLFLICSFSAEKDKKYIIECIKKDWIKNENNLQR